MRQTITTTTGSRYLRDGNLLTRLSEAPIEHRPAMQLNAEPVCFDFEPEIGACMLFNTAEGWIRTTPVVSIEDTP